MYGGKGDVHTGFWWGNVRGRDHLEDLCLDRKKILKRKFKKWDGSVDSIGVVQDREKRQALVNAVMNSWVP